MRNKEKTEKDASIHKANPPLFTGDYVRDTAVSEFEKIADAAQTIHTAWNKLIAKKKNQNK